MRLQGVNTPEWEDPNCFVVPVPDAGMPPGMSRTVLGDVALEFQSAWGVRPLLTIATGLGVAAAATIGRQTVRIASGATFPVGLYLLPTASPGAMKSPTLTALGAPLAGAQAGRVRSEGPAVTSSRIKADALRAAIKKLSDELAASHTGQSPKARKPDAIVAEIEGLDMSLRELADGGSLDGIEPVVIGADLTYEAVIRRAERNGGKIALLSAEGGLMENLAGRYSDGAARTEFLNSAYDGEPYDGERVSDGQRSIPKPWATMLLVVQPDVLGTMLKSSNMRRRGFLQRFLPLSIPDAPYQDRHNMPGVGTAIEVAWSKAITGIWDGCAAEVDATGAALQPLRDFEHEVIGPAFARAQVEHNYLQSGWLSKLAMTSTRVAAVITGLETPSAAAVTVSAAGAAVGFAATALAHADYLFAHGMQAASSAPPLRVLTWLVDGFGGSGGIGRVHREAAPTTRDCWQRFKDQSWCDTADDARHVLTGLARYGWLKGPTTETTDKGGRPSEVWELHPEALKHYIAMTGTAPKTHAEHHEPEAP